MDADALVSTNSPHLGNVDGQIVSCRELAVERDVHGTPTRWLTLNNDNPEDRRLLAELVIRWQAPGRAA